MRPARRPPQKKIVKRPLQPGPNNSASRDAPERKDRAVIYTTVTDRRGVRIIKLLADQIMFHNYDQVFKKVKNAISEDDNLIVLDMEKVTFMDSISMGMMVPLLLYTRRVGGELVVTGLCDDIKALFAMLRLDNIIQIKSSVAEAVTLLKAMEGAPDE